MITSLRNKILIPTIVLIFIGLAGSVAISYIRFQKIIGNMAGTHIEQLASAAANHLDVWIETTRLNVKSWSEELAIQTAATDGYLGQASRGVASERLKKIIETYGFFEEVMLTDSSGTVIAAGDTKLIGQLKISDRVFFQEGMKGNAMISDVVQSKISGNNIFVVAFPVRQASQNKVLGVLAAGIDLGIFYKRFIEPIRVGTTGYAYIYNQEGVIIAHPNKDDVLKKSIGDFGLSPEMLTKQKGSFSYILNNVEMTAAVKKVEITNWFVTVAVHKSELLEPARNIRYIMILIAAAVILIVSLAIFFIAKSVTRPLDDVGKILEGIAKGNLGTGIEIKSHDEIGKMANDLNHAVSNLKNMMLELSDTTQRICGSSEELSAVSEEMASSAEEMSSQAFTVAGASEQIAANVSVVAAATEQSGASLSGIASMTEEMSSSFVHIVESGQKTSGNVKAIAESGEEISLQIRSIAASTEEMTVSLNEVAKNTVKANQISQNAIRLAEDVNTRMITLSAASKKIGKVVGIIKDIADQTNMLALNATIEAAGAGDAGRGFAVVAGEVKELAKQSAGATDEIAEQIEEIQKSVINAVTAIQDIGHVITQIADINQMIASSAEEQTATAGEISKSAAGTSVAAKAVAQNSAESSRLVEDIVRAMEESSGTAKEVARSIEEVFRSVQDVARSVDEAAKGVNEISKNIQGISSASKGTAIGASQIREASGELAKMSIILTEMIGRFKLE